MEDDGEPELITADAVAEAPPINKTHNLKPMSGGKRLLAFFLILLGLWTFVAPTISTDPPVLGRAVWSPLEIVTQTQAGKLPTGTAGEGVFDGLEIEFAISYLLLLLALLDVMLINSSTPLVAFAALGAYICLLRYSTSDPWNPFAGFETFYGPHGSWHSHIYVAQHKLLLLIVNLLTLGIVWMESVDNTDR